MFRACSIDVGKVNLGVYIEEFSSVNDGEAIYLQRIDLTLCKKERVTVTFLRRMFDFLDSIKTHLDRCDYFVIEKQMRVNPEAQFVDHAIQSYFLIHYKDKEIVSFSSKNKTHVFDDTKMTKYQRKKWAVEKAIKMFTERGDTERLNYIKSLKKKDDVSDAFCQLEAFKAFFFSQKKKLTKAFTDKGFSLDSLEEKLVETPQKKPKKVTEPNQVVAKPKRVYKKKVVDPVVDKPVVEPVDLIAKPKRVYKRKPNVPSQEPIDKTN